MNNTAYTLKGYVIFFGVLLSGVILAGYLLLGIINNRKLEDWYLVYSGQDKDYLVKSEVKPYTKDGFIYIDGESFITPESGMTCKPVEGEVVRAAIEEQSVNKERKK